MRACFKTISKPISQAGFGFAMRDTDDGKIIANYITKGGPAEKAGMKWGAEIPLARWKTHQ